MERAFVETERKARRIRAEFIREIAGNFGQFVKRGFGRIAVLLSQPSHVEAK